MPLKIPRKNTADWAAEIVAECQVSQQRRVSEGQLWRNYYFNGSGTNGPAIFNKVLPAIQDVSSYLFSPSEVTFTMDFDQSHEVKFMSMGELGAKLLTRQFHNDGIDLIFGRAVENALVKGSSFIKANWGHEGFDPVIIQPELMGVLREDINDLSRQEAFFHQQYLTPGQFRRLVAGRDDAAELIKLVEKTASATSPDAEQDNILHSLILGGMGNAVAQQGQVNPNIGNTLIFGGPAPMLNPRVAGKLIKMYELWAFDEQLQDWVTLQLIHPGILIAGRHKLENLCGVKGETPFHQVCPNEIDGYFWGQSEVATIQQLQNTLNDRMGEIDRMARLRADAPRVFTGFSSMNDEVYDALNSPGGYVSEPTPGAEFKDMKPEMPGELFGEVNQLIEYYNEMLGMTPSLKGRGEAGVRSQGHAETLVRTSSPRLRDRALLVERQCSSLADFCFKVLQNKDTNIYQTRDGNEFYLSQLPDDFKISVDSHSSSPAFTQNYQDLAFALHKDGAIDAKALLQLTHPPMEDILVEQAERKAKAEEQMMAQAKQADPQGFFDKLLGGKSKKK